MRFEQRSVEVTTVQASSEPRLEARGLAGATVTDLRESALAEAALMENGAGKPPG